MPKVNVPKGGRVIEFDPKKFYIVVFSRQDMTYEDREYLEAYLKDQGVKGVSVIIHGDPKSVNVIEQNKKRPTL